MPHHFPVLDLQIYSLFSQLSLGIAFFKTGIRALDFKGVMSVA
jgi:hypothetical protein